MDKTFVRLAIFIVTLFSNRPMKIVWKESAGLLVAKGGVYSPIGTESAPIIQFDCSVGLNDLARKSLGYFIDNPQYNGQIMNYHGYTIETGAVL